MKYTLIYFVITSKDNNNNILFKVLKKKSYLILNSMNMNKEAIFHRGV